MSSLLISRLSSKIGSSPYNLLESIENFNEITTGLLWKI